MGIKLFGGLDIAKMVYAPMKGKMVPATLTKYTAGARDPDNLAGGTSPTATSYSCEGFTDDKNLQGAGVGYRVTDNIVRAERLVCIFGDSLLQADGSRIIPHGDPNGQTGDRVTILGETYSIIRVRRDPAEALYICTCRA